MRRIVRALAVVGAAAMWFDAVAAGAAEQRAVPAAALSISVEDFGELRPAGAYPAPPRGNTVTVLPNGAIFVYGSGASLHEWAGQDAQNSALRRRYEKAVATGIDREPMLWDPQRRGWHRLPPAPECKTAEHFLHTATALPDGRVLIAGGLCNMPRLLDDTSPHVGHAVLSLWNSATRQWQAAPVLNQPRIFHTATLLADGSVLIVGGQTDPLLAQTLDPAVLASVERFAHDRVAPAAPLQTERAKHSATLLADGSVLVAGGFGQSGNALSSAEQWDPHRAAWRELPPMRVPRHSHTATRLADGRVLVAGGVSLGNKAVTSAEIWDPERQAWFATEDLPVALRGHAASEVAPGRVLVAGGTWGLSLSVSWPWAWTWSADSNRWAVAGRARAKRENELSSQITLVPQSDGSALAFTPAGIFRWVPGAAEPASLAPLWGSRPSAVALGDGRVLFIGWLSDDAASGSFGARLWSPQNGSWATTAAPPASRWRHANAIELQSRRVLYAGLSEAKELGCALWDPVVDAWTDCKPQPLEYLTEWRIRLGRLVDGRAFALLNRHEALVLDELQRTWASWQLDWPKNDWAVGSRVQVEQPLARIRDPASGKWHEINEAAARMQHDWAGNRGPRLRWNAKAGHWTYVMQRTAMGPDALLLPDGCVFSPAPLAVFDPATEAVKPLHDPGIGIEPDHAETLVLQDGTVVMAGPAIAPRTRLGGFFVRSVSCSGFAEAPTDRNFIAGNMAIDPAPAAAPRAAAKVDNRPPTPWYLRAAATAQAHRWPILLGLGLVLAYVVLRGLGVRRVQWGPSWALRLAIYGVGALFVANWIRSFVQFERATSERACSDDARSCLDPRTGILKPAPLSQGGTAAATTIPCAMVGLWAARHGSTVRRIELRDDGTYEMFPNQMRSATETGYTGFWAVQGQTMIWRHQQGSNDLDINPMQIDGTDRFTLTEGNGSRTRFELIRATPSTRCTP
ncbi:MAG: Kelch repeat-containing protein [Betaproteobacteria bacterium]